MDDETADDAALLRRLAGGDRAALADAFDRFAPTLTRYAWALADTPEDAAGLVQDTFLTLWQQADALALPTGRLLPWLLTACRDHSSDRLRGEVRDSDTAEQLRWVQDEIATLPDTDRRICELCLLQGHSYAEAAQLLGLSVSAATQPPPRSRRRPRKAVTNDEH